MDFDDTPEEAEFRAGARAFLDKNAKRREPGAGMVYRAGNESPEFRQKAKDWQARKADAGYAGITWPKDWGGRGGTAIQQVIYDQEEVEVRRAARPVRHRARHVHPDAVHLGHAGTARPLRPQGAARRGDLVPAVLRAGRRLRPCRPAHARGARRRRLGRQRPEDLDLAARTTATSACW